MVTLVINPGSSSKKYVCYNGEKALITIRFEKTTDGYGQVVQIDKTKNRQQDVTLHEYQTSLKEVLKIIEQEKIVSSLDEITNVAIRIVAPSKYFQVHRVIDETFIDRLAKIEHILPLHIPPTLEEIKATKEYLPQAKLVGVSDSAFHSTIPAVFNKYSLKEAEDFEIKRYGYHGLSVNSIADKLSSVFGHIRSKVVVAHIGSGVSITALKNGQSIYNSMGYSPASGVMMGSRAGDVDPGALIEILNRSKTKLVDGHKYIQTNGGFSGLLGVSDLRTVLMREEKTDPAAIEALAIFLFNIQSQIASATVALGGINALVLTATAMERNPDLRQRIISGLDWLNIKIDKNLNEETISRSGIISTDDSQVAVALIPTSEMEKMAKLANNI